MFSRLHTITLIKPMIGFFFIVWVYMAYLVYKLFYNIGHNLIQNEENK